MGGHGGLNILPQKSWNVYGQKNRQKVAEDEAERDKKEAKAQAQQERSARELRLRALRGSLQEAVRIISLPFHFSFGCQHAVTSEAQVHAIRPSQYLNLCPIMYTLCL
jgi:hypothetical protein